MNLVVYSGGERAGVLGMAAGEPFYGFTYDRAYLASPNAAPLSASLPLQKGRFDGAQALYAAFTFALLGIPAATSALR